MIRRFEKLVDGLGFAEGPAWHPAGFLVFSDIAGDRLLQWDASGTRVLRMPSGKANGNAFDTDGRLVSCEHLGSRVVREEADGTITVLASHYSGRALNSPNDLAFDAKGVLHFSDPSFGRLRDDLGRVRELELSFRGVYRLDPDVGLVLLADDFDQPNGLCFSPDFRFLYVNDTRRMHIRRFRVLENGTVADGSVWSRVEGDEPGVPDGMKCDGAGNVWCTGPGGLHVYSPAGDRIEVIETPERLTNFCFAPPGVFLTAPTALYLMIGAERHPRSV
jgi:gluconolactonase